MALLVKTLECPYCGTLFQTAYVKSRYCSTSCQTRGRRLERADADDPRPSPDVWDGQTRYNDLPQKEHFRTVCINCGTGDWLHGTLSKGPSPVLQGHRRLVGLRPCDQCGGKVIVVPDVELREPALVGAGFRKGWDGDADY
jgi:hypothetical protein